jgi:hypothetical protein
MAEVPRISTTARKQVVDLTDQVEAVIRKAKMQEELCALFITHTTVALTTGEVGEGTEQDFLQVVEQMITRHLAIRDVGRSGWPTRTNCVCDGVSILTSASSALGEVCYSVVPR